MTSIGLAFDPPASAATETEYIAQNSTNDITATANPRSAPNFLGSNLVETQAARMPPPTGNTKPYSIGIPSTLLKLSDPILIAKYTKAIKPQKNPPTPL
jgi:hypothetical protein